MNELKLKKQTYVVKEVLESAGAAVIAFSVVDKFGIEVFNVDSGVGEILLSFTIWDTLNDDIVTFVELEKLEIVTLFNVEISEPILLEIFPSLLGVEVGWSARMQGKDKIKSKAEMYVIISLLFMIITISKTSNPKNA